MSAPNELRFIVDQLTSPPFSKLNGIISTLTSITPIQLHDDLPLISLLQVVTDVMAFIDDANSQPGGSLHRGVDLRQEQYEETAARMGDFLRMLKCKSAINREEFIKGIMDGDRGLILSVLYFLLKDYQIHKKRAYLAPYLASIEIPPEYTQDDCKSLGFFQVQTVTHSNLVILDLQNSVENLQNEFKESHKYLDSLRNSGILEHITLV
ncbi:Intraflagellar transport protein 81 [Nowakowskiella sp. JEL0407]|nr:Intraflagellar transport protein 81 [Nowakowskiella sp. JEL0407]